MYKEFYRWLNENARKLKKTNENIFFIKKKLLPGSAVAVICSKEKMGSVVVKNNFDMYYEILSIQSGDVIQSQITKIDVREDAESIFELLLDLY